MTPRRIIGWDAAVAPRNNALVLAEVDRGRDGAVLLQVKELVQPENAEELSGTLFRWCSDEAPPPMLCVDSPLGWPAALGPALVEHRAGEAIKTQANTLFRRFTDRELRRRLGKTPLDVGADRIARTALAVLSTLGGLRERLARPPVVVLDVEASLDGGGEIPVLETYPAGWFASERIKTRGYRPAEARERRAQLLANSCDVLKGRGILVSPPSGMGAFAKRADDLDALVCVFAGLDVLLGLVPGPPQDHWDMVSVEGWIWCKTAP